MKILIIGASHGNELLGVKLYQRLLRTHSPLLEHVDFIVGNPKAYTAKMRYIDSDLNRSYQDMDNGYEAKRAKEIKRYIGQTHPDIVLDMHTTNCVQPNCLIISDTHGEAKQRFLRACHIDTVLQVQSLGDILSLGNFVVGYEVPNLAITAQLLDDIAADLQRFVDGASAFPRKKLFTMSGKIYKKDVTPTQAKSFKNFEPHKLGFVPIMTGENSYKKQTDYLGFQAKKPEVIVLHDKN